MNATFVIVYTDVRISQIATDSSLHSFILVHLQVQFKGKTIKLNLKVNTMLLGSDFVIERYKEDDSIERKASTDIHCYLVGETESFHSSVAISDCDGLVRTVQ